MSTETLVFSFAIVWAFTMGAAVTYAILKRRHAAEIKSWTDPFRDVVHQRDRLERELHEIRRYHAMVASARVESVRWN
jgi:hypothetical protein